ncbi:MAG: cysteine hydrolase family protein [Clostridiaceae bacterium]
MKTILLVVDVQQALVEEGPAHKDEFLLNLKLLIEQAHESEVEVVYVRHDGGEGDILAMDTAGWHLHCSLSPRADEKVFDKRFSSSFRKTGLQEYLDGKGVKRIVLCGMQTEYCIDTTCKVAFEFGYDVVIPSGGTTTYTNPLLSGEKLINYYERLIWHQPLASVKPMEKVLELLKNANK